MNKKSAIAILGGMGPEASSYLYGLLIKLAIKKFGAKNNNDFPEILLHSVPVPDFISNVNDKEIALEMLKKRTIALNNCNIACLSIACNTAHLLLDDLQKVSQVPFISMLDAVSQSVKKDRIHKVGILGSPITLQTELYQKKLKVFGITCIIPTQSEQLILERIIRNIISGKLLAQDKASLVAIAINQQMKGAEGIVLGCTELPMLFQKQQMNIKIYNSLEILATSLLQKYYKSNTIQQYD